MTRFSGVGGVALAGDSCGPADGQPVVLMHGGGQTRHSWKRSAKRLARLGYHVTAFDLRGHGESEWAADGSYRIEDLVADFAAVARTLHRAPIVIGASLGGIVALLAAGAGLPVKALVLVDIGVSINNAGSARVREFMAANIDGFASVEDAAEAVRRYNPRPGADPSGLIRNLRPGAGDRLYWHWDPAMFFGAVSLQAEVIEPMTRDAARKIDVPTLLLRGESSDVVSEADGREFERLIPSARVEHVASVGHMIVGDDNEAFQVAIEGFLARHPSLRP